MALATGMTRPLAPMTASVSVPRKATEAWLTQRVELSVPFVRGSSLEQLALAAFKSGDAKQVDAVLARRREYLSTEFVVPESIHAVHPPAAPQRTDWT